MIVLNHLPKGSKMNCTVGDDFRIWEWFLVFLCPLAYEIKVAANHESKRQSLFESKSALLTIDKVWLIFTRYIAFQLFLIVSFSNGMIYHFFWKLNDKYAKKIEIIFLSLNEFDLINNEKKIIFTLLCKVSVSIVI